MDLSETAVTTEHFDVVVVGGGGSGLAAAIEARELGRSVVLLEKNPTLGGSTARSIGSVTATNTPHQRRKGILDSPDHHFEDLTTINRFLCAPDNEALRRILVDNVPETMRWLMASGVEFHGPLPEIPHRRPRMHNVLPNSRAYIYHLQRRAQRAGVDIRPATPARKLITDDKKVVGVLADSARGPVRFIARGGVVLASGDYSAAKTMVAELISPEAATLPPINPTNTGDGHRMALELGAKIVNPHLYHWGLRFQPPAKPSWVARLPPLRLLARSMRLALDIMPGWMLRPLIMSFLTTIALPSPRLYKFGAVLINQRGERFGDETVDPERRLIHQPDQLCYVLLDGTLAKKFSRWPYYISTAPGIAYAFVADYRRNRKDIFHRADSLAELAGKIGVPAAALEHSVAEQNAALATNPVADKQQLTAPPFIALGPVRCYITFTDGGLAVTPRLEVLGQDDQPIAGLYAAGFTGMGGILLEGHGHHLGWAFTSGRLAGRNAAHRVVSDELAVSPS